MASWNEDPPTIIEHTTINPTVERTTIIERDSWYSEPWAVALIIGAIAVIGLIAYWALYNPNSTTPSVVSNTTIERPAPERQRAQIIEYPAPTQTPKIVVVPAAKAPTININTPASSNNTTPSSSDTNNNAPSGANTPSGSSDGNPSQSNGDSTGSNGSGSGDNTSGNNSGQ
jgi:hypothetical protein